MICPLRNIGNKEKIYNRNKENIPKKLYNRNFLFFKSKKLNTTFMYFSKYIVIIRGEIITIEIITNITFEFECCPPVSLSDN